MVFLCLGTQPQTKLARYSNLEVQRGIVVNNKLETTDSDIYAIGDAIQVDDIVNHEPAIIPLAGLAIKQVMPRALKASSRRAGRVYVSRRGGGG